MGARRQILYLGINLSADSCRPEVDIAEFLLDTAEEDSGGIVDGIVEYGRLLACLGGEAVVAIEKLDAGDDNAYEQSALEHTNESAQEAVDPSEADNAEQFGNEPAHEVEEKGYDNQYKYECRDVSGLGGEVQRVRQPFPYREVEGTTEEQASNQPCQAGNLLHGSVAQATDKSDGEQHGDDDVNRLHDINREREELSAAMCALLTLPS